MKAYTQPFTFLFLENEIQFFCDKVKPAIKKEQLIFLIRINTNLSEMIKRSGTMNYNNCPTPPLASLKVFIHENV